IGQPDAYNPIFTKMPANLLVSIASQYRSSPKNMGNPHWGEVLTEMSARHLFPSASTIHVKADLTS
ncbi:MAG: hypothetical protein AB2707_07190, partial [Candidatus Thiodiazotropha sp.]